eukprot:IDg3725t1
MLLRDTLDVFECVKRQTRDYHGMFNHKYFVDWIRKLLDSLKAHYIKNAIIVIETQSITRKLLNDAPKMQWKKAALIETCNMYDITVPLDLKPIETVWAVVKGALGRQYTTQTTFKICTLRARASPSHTHVHFLDVILMGRIRLSNYLGP